MRHSTCTQGMGKDRAMALSVKHGPATHPRCTEDTLAQPSLPLKGHMGMCCSTKVTGPVPFSQVTHLGNGMVGGSRVGGIVRHTLSARWGGVEGKADDCGNAKELQSTY